MIHKHSKGCDGSRGGFLSASFCCKIRVSKEISFKKVDQSLSFNGQDKNEQTL